MIVHLFEAGRMVFYLERLLQNCFPGLHRQVDEVPKRCYFLVDLSRNEVSLEHLLMIHDLVDPGLMVLHVELIFLKYFHGIHLLPEHFLTHSYFLIDFLGNQGSFEYLLVVHVVFYVVDPGSMVVLNVFHGLHLLLGRFLMRCCFLEDCFRYQFPL